MLSKHNFPQQSYKNERSLSLTGTWVVASVWMGLSGAFLNSWRTTLMGNRIVEMFARKPGHRRSGGE